MRLLADSVSSAAPPLSSELPYTWSRTTTTEETFPELKYNVIRKTVQLQERLSPLQSAVGPDEALFGLHAVIEFILCTAVSDFNMCSHSYQRKSFNLLWLHHMIHLTQTHLRLYFHVSPLGTAFTGCVGVSTLLCVLDCFFSLLSSCFSSISSSSSVSSSSPKLDSGLSSSSCTKEVRLN